MHTDYNKYFACSTNTVLFALRQSVVSACRRIKTSWKILKNFYTELTRVNIEPPGPESNQRNSNFFYCCSGKRRLQLRTRWQRFLAHNRSIPTILRTKNKHCATWRLRLNTPIKSGWSTRMFFTRLWDRKSINAELEDGMTWVSGFKIKGCSRKWGCVSVD